MRVMLAHRSGVVNPVSDDWLCAYVGAQPMRLEVLVAQNVWRIDAVFLASDHGHWITGGGLRRQR
jgi:hypothetical protein